MHQNQYLFEKINIFRNSKKFNVVCLIQIPKLIAAAWSTSVTIPDIVLIANTGWSRSIDGYTVSICRASWVGCNFWL